MVSCSISKDRREAKVPVKSKLRLVTPAIENRAVVPRRPKNAELRRREHLTPAEVERMIEAAKNNRHGHRDATMILVAYRHGLRAAEVCSLEWSQVDFALATLHVRRVKSGKPSTHPIRGDEMRALRKLQREAPKSPFMFVSARGGLFADEPEKTGQVEGNGEHKPELGGLVRLQVQFVFKKKAYRNIHQSAGGGTKRQQN